MDIEIGFTDREITPWGGMILFRKLLDQLEFSAHVEKCTDLPVPGSNRGYSPKTIIEAFLVSVWCGANRFLHTEVTRQDNTIAEMFGWKQAPGQDTFKRFFAKFTQGRNQGVSDHFYSWIFEHTKFDNYTIDCDSTILTRFGKQQEGVKKGYNPHKPGRPSHHPIIAFISDVKLVANFWLRSGDSSSAEGFVPFLEETLKKLGNKKASLLRLDSGFFSGETFDYLEKKSLNYIVAARFYETMQKLIATQQGWLCIDEGIEIAETVYRAESWEKERRVILVRQRIKQRPDAAGKKLRLFQEEEIYNQYRYSAYVTNLPLSAVEVWRLYRGRADAENRIKELKYDFGFGSFNMKDFYGTEAALIFTMLAYNLMSLFRQFVLNSKTQHTLATLRYKTLAIGAYFDKSDDRYILKLALSLKRREWFTGLWLHAKSFQLPLGVSIA